jgi:hypothetical protein
MRLMRVTGWGLGAVGFESPAMDESEQRPTRNQSEAPLLL